MKIAFSTLGCPGWEWGEIVASAADLGYDGIEIRGICKEIYAPSIAMFSQVNAAATKKRLAALKLEISCFTSACYLFDKPNQAEVLRISKEYIDTANRIGAANIRVLGDQDAYPQGEVDMGLVEENLSELATYAADKGVTVLLESNGVFAQSKLLAELLKKVDSPYAGALWDTHHPYRYYNEQPEITYENLKPYLRYLHMKDSLSVNGKTVYKMMSEGDVPNKQIIKMLSKDDFSGYLSIEWVKRWDRTLSEPGIVFPHFINYVKSIIK